MSSISYADVLAAHENHQQVPGIILHTPLARPLRVEQESGVDVYCKLELLQRTGAFKMRGATNAMLAYRKKHGQFPKKVMAWSSGNHAQAVAYAAREFGVPATIVMPDDAPIVKRYNTAFLGAEIKLYARNKENREEVARAAADDPDTFYIPPFDLEDVMAGQGTCGKEIVEDCEKAGFQPDAVIVPVGGGGLLAGVSVAIKHHWPDCKVYGAEPESHDDTFRSLESGVLVGNDDPKPSICDALLTPTPGKLVFPVLQQHVDGIFLLNDDEVREAIGRIHIDLRVIAEPGGAIGYAAMFKHLDQFRGKKVVVILSGGNADATILGNAVASANDGFLARISSNMASIANTE